MSWRTTQTHEYCRAMSVDTPTSELIRLAPQFPQAIDQNPIRHIIALEDPAMYIKLWHARTLGWRRQVLSLHRDCQNEIAWRAADHVKTFWLQRFTDQESQTDLFCGNRRRAEIFELGLRLRHDLAVGKISDAKFRELREPYMDEEKTCRFPMNLSPLGVLCMAIMPPFPNEDSEILWQAEEVKLCFHRRHKGEFHVTE